MQQKAKKRTKRPASTRKHSANCSKPPLPASAARPPGRTSETKAVWPAMSTKEAISLCASPRRIPVPAKISGRFAALIFSKISTAVDASTFGGISSAHSDLSKCFRSSVSTMAAWISNGTSNHTGPPLPALLKYNAFSK